MCCCLNCVFFAGQNTNLLISILVKHLDHKNVIKKPRMQVNIVNVTIQLAQNTKLRPSIAIVGAISDLVKHLRKCMQYSAEASIHGDNTDRSNSALQSALEECLTVFTNKVLNCALLLFSFLNICIHVYEPTQRHNFSWRSSHKHFALFCMLEVCQCYTLIKSLISEYGVPGNYVGNW